MKAASSHPFDANFEGLLREAAASPRSMLLRVKRPDVFPALRSREAPASVAMAGLSSIERELLSSYRSELGFLLRQATFARLMSDEQTRPMIDSTAASHEVHQLPSNSELKEGFLEYLNLRQENRTESEVSDEPRCIRHQAEGRDQETSTLALATMALRIEPVDQARVYAGAYYAATGNSSASIDVLGPVLDGRSAASNEALAREWIAWALGLRTNFSEAAECMKLAVDLGLPRPELALRFLLYSALSGDRTAVSHSMALVAESVLEPDVALDDFCAGIRTHVKPEMLLLSRRDWNSLKELGRKSDAASYRIINELIARTEQEA